MRFAVTVAKGLQAPLYATARETEGGSEQLDVADGDAENGPYRATLQFIRVFALMKRWGLGTYYGLRHKHIDTYLNEFVFHYNRPFFRRFCSRRHA